RKMRETSRVPIIMLTARGDVADRIVGLELGADDYLPKPFEPRELVARMQAVLRRGAHEQEDIVRVGPLELNWMTRSASLKGRALLLTTAEFELLGLLVRNRGRVLTRDRIMEAMRGLDADAYDRSIDVLVSRVRQKLGDDAKRATFIRTVRGIGYSFAGDRRDLSRRHVLRSCFGLRQARRGDAARCRQPAAARGGLFLVLPPSGGQPLDRSHPDDARARGAATAAVVPDVRRRARGAHRPATAAAPAPRAERRRGPPRRRRARRRAPERHPRRVRTTDGCLQPDGRARSRDDRRARSAADRRQPRAALAVDAYEGRSGTGASRGAARRDDRRRRRDGADDCRADRARAAARRSRPPAGASGSRSLAA